MERGLDFLLNSFLFNKIDDRIAHSVETSKLFEMGLVYGDNIAFRNAFPSENIKTVSSYKEKAKELQKEKIKKTHSGKNDCKNRPISINKTY